MVGEEAKVGMPSPSSLGFGKDVYERAARLEEHCNRKGMGKMVSRGDGMVARREDGR